MPEFYYFCTTKLTEMKIDILLGLQWGDEGKGKVVDVLTPSYDVIARFQGGANAGHSLEFNGMKHVLHLIPSGIFHKDKINIIGNGVVIDPVGFQNEIEALINLGLSPVDNLFISKKAHLILPTHILLDKFYENKKGNLKIGSTLKGIGPAYTDKSARNGLRIGDLLLSSFNEKYNSLINNHKEYLSKFGFDYENILPGLEESWLKSLETIRKFTFIDSEYVVNEYLDQDRSFLAEGAQGTLLDVDFGAYPYVTSSNTVAAGTFTGLGIAPSRVGKVIGIVKAYCTRVGSGPFPTELFDETADKLRKNGFEYGSTTGRPRRCGWLDLVALNYSIMLNGVTEMVLTKADVLSDFEDIKICTAYKINGATVNKIPFDNDAPVEPVYTTLKGWNKDISNMKSFDEFPVELKEYIGFIEQITKVKISMISVGADRLATVKR